MKVNPDRRPSAQEATTHHWFQDNPNFPSLAFRCPPSRHECEGSDAPSVRFSPSGVTFVVITREKLYTFCHATNTVRKTYSSPDSSFVDAFYMAETSLVVLEKNGRITDVNIDFARPMLNLYNWHETPTLLAASASTKRIACGSRNWIWMFPRNGPPGVTYVEMHGLGGPPRTGPPGVTYVDLHTLGGLQAMAFSSNGNTLMAAFTTRFLVLKIEQNIKFTVQANRLYHIDALQMAFFPQGDGIVYSNHCGVVWCELADQTRPAFKIHQPSNKSPCTSLSFDSTGLFLAAARADGTTTLYKLHHKEIPVVLDTNISPAVRVSLSPDGTILAAASATPRPSIAIWHRV